MSKYNSSTRNQPKGPFRGLILTFFKNIDPQGYKDILSKITFEHPNYMYSENNKRRCIIYYNNSYDVATVLEAYRGDEHFNMSIFYDKMSKTLDPLVLYIKKPNIKVLRVIHLLNGEIITKTNLGCQVKFENFKAAAFAHEELGRETSVKFAYISEVPKSSYRTNLIEVEKNELQEDVQKLFEKYACYTPALRNEFKKSFEELEESQPKRKIRKEETYEEQHNPEPSSSSAVEPPKNKHNRDKFVLTTPDNSDDEWDDIITESKKITHRSMPNL